MHKVLLWTHIRIIDTVVAYTTPRRTAKNIILASKGMCLLAFV